MEYKFFVSDPRKLDLQRIVREAPARVNHILLVPAGNRNTMGLLLVKQSWLEKFGREDGLALCGEILTATWGVGKPAACGINNNSFSFGYKGIASMEHQYGTTLLLAPQGWRYRTTGNIECTIIEVNKAKEFKPKCEVVVKYL